MASYEVVVYDPAGNRIGGFFQFSKLDYFRAENEIGMLELVVHPNSPLRKLLVKDLKLEIWRTLSGSPYVEGNTAWFVRKWKISRDLLEITAYDANYILSGRIVDYASESSQASKTGAIDNLMKAVFRENFGSLSVDTTRSVASLVECVADVSAAPSTTKAFSRRNVLTVLKELAEESLQRGTYLVFDVQYVGQNKLRFATFVGQLGVNHGVGSPNPLIIGESSSSLANAVLVRDYSNEVTVVTAGGEGTGADRVISTVISAKISETNFSRRERFVNALSARTDSNAVNAEARAELAKSAATITLTGSIQENKGLVYGLDYGYGDIIVASFEGFNFNAHVDRIHNTVTKDGEKLDNRIRGVA